VFLDRKETTTLNTFAFDGLARETKAGTTWTKRAKNNELSEACTKNFDQMAIKRQQLYYSAFASDFGALGVPSKKYIRTD
jgi:hypothetical protein